MTELTELKKIIMHFNIKYKGDWDMVYGAIQKKEAVDFQVINNISSRDEECISIVDNSYPPNFKNIYMPPLMLFFYGNLDLAYCNEKIISLWGDVNKNVFNDLCNIKNNVYALSYTEKNIELIKNVCGYNFILIDTNAIDDNKKDEINLLNKENKVLLLTEVDSELSNNITMNQNLKRILFGVSATKILVSFDEHIIEDLLKINTIEESALYIYKEFKNEQTNKNFKPISKISELSN